MSNGKSYMPKVLTFTVGKNFNPQDMEDEIAKFTLNGWKIISMTHFQYKNPYYTELMEAS